MTTVLDWVRELWTDKKELEETKVKEEPKELDLKSLEEQVATMHMSGCGCYRYPARALFAKYSVGSTPEETVQAYTILRGKLHSSCRGSSYTSSNMETVRTALDAVYTVLEQGRPEARGALLHSLGEIVDDLSHDTYRDDEFADSEMQRVSILASKYMEEQDYSAATKMLTVAKKMARKSKQAKDAEEMIVGLMDSYRPQIIRSLCRKRGEALEEIEEVIYRSASGGVQQKLLERVDKIKKGRAAYVDQFPQMAARHYRSKIRPLEREIGDAERSYAPAKEKLEQEAVRGRTEYDTSIRYYLDREEKTSEASLRQEFSTMIGKKVAQKTAYERGMHEKFAVLDAEKEGKVGPLQEQIAELKRTHDEAVQRYRAGTMTRAEYKAMDHEMREKKK